MKNELCYYCNVTAFKSIIENHSFWLSDIHYMNDSSEESLFLDALTEVMINQREQLSTQTKEHLDSDTFMNSFFTNIKNNYKNFVYICCFSDSNNDDLSQWRGYADDGKGVCIGLKKDKIKKLSDWNMIVLNGDGHKEYAAHNYVFAQRNIIYSDKSEIISELKEKVTPLVREYDASDKKTVVPPIPDSSFTIKLYNETFNYKSFYKNKSFQSENEYRICFYDKLHHEALEIPGDALKNNMQKKYQIKDDSQKEVVEFSELKFRESKNYLIPYRIMKFEASFFKDLISSITIGPKNPMSENDIKYFLVANGFDISNPNINVEKSKSTYQ